MRIGYSFWGFLGPGITNTPDGGRSHRRVLVDGLISRGHELIFLQPNRDLDEAGHDLTPLYRWDSGLPVVDALFLEWRWPIPGRNTTPCGSSGHTCDLHRQRELIQHYTSDDLITIIWDKDLRLPPDDPVRHQHNVLVCEAALHPSPDAERLLFPVPDAALGAADPTSLAATERPLDLSYVGNQYDRDDAFETFFAPAAMYLRHLVAGKWTRTSRWPHVTFVGRIPFHDVHTTYRRSLTTVTLLPDRYCRAGQMTQRLGEAVLAGCLPLTPTTIRSVERLAPSRLHVSDGRDVLAAVQSLSAIAGTEEHAALLSDCLGGLDSFRLSHQLCVLDQLLSDSGPVSVQRPDSAK